MRIKATDQLNGTLQSLSLVVRQKVRVYDRASDTWTAPALNLNPAWVGYWLLTACPALSKHVPDTRIHLDTFADYAEFCTVNSFEARGVVDAATTAAELIEDLLSCSLGWRLLLPPIMTTRWPIAIAVVIALSAGLSNGINSSYSASRTLVFFPFFVAGYVLGMPTKPRRLMGAVGLVCLAGLAWVYREFPARWFYGSAPYEQVKAVGATVGATPVEGIVTRATIMLGGAAGVWSVLQLVPTADRLTAWLGQQSLGAYLLHGFVIKYGVAVGWLAIMSAWPTGWRVVCAAIFGLAATIILSVAGRYLRWSMDYDWLWKRKSQPVTVVPADSISKP